MRGWVNATLEAQPEGWVPVPVTLPPGAYGPESRVEVPVLFPPGTARFGVISDMDDTVLQSSVGNVVGAARLVFFGNAHTRLPFPGVGAFYRALHSGASGAEGNPIFYVSSSPWNLYDVIEEFLRAQGIPAGPLLLRDWDATRSIIRNREHKAALIREVFATYSGMPFILIGDTTQEDPEIYSALVHDYPGRILAVYIRNVHPTPERSNAIATLATAVAAAGSTLILADDTVGAARHAAEQGWISPDRLPGVAADARADEGKPPAPPPAPAG